MMNTLLFTLNLVLGTVNLIIAVRHGFWFSGLAAGFAYGAIFVQFVALAVT